jgi:hypothetical protein
VHIQKGEHSFASKHLPSTRESIPVDYTLSPKVYQVLTFDAEYIFMTRNLKFPTKTSPSIGTTLGRIVQDTELDLESNSYDQRLMDLSSTISG